MATGSVGREHPLQHTHYLRKNITYATTGIGTAATVKAGTLPPNAIVLSTRVKINTAFNAGTTNLLKVGTSSNDDALVESGAVGNGDGDVDVTTAGMTTVLRGGDLAKSSSDIDIYVQFTETGTAASAGDADIIVEYIPDNDD